MAISIRHDTRDDGHIAFSVLLSDHDPVDPPTMVETIASIHDALRINRLGTIAEAQWEYRHVTLLIQLAGCPYARNLHLVRDTDDWEAADPRPELIEHYIRLGFESPPRPWGSQ
jgi:hypothetical protein